MKQLDIAIAGAGPAGLAAALYLNRTGHRVTIFERFDEALPLGSGLILQPTGLTVLHDLGLFDEIAALGSRIDRLYGADAKSGRTVLDVRYASLNKGRYGIAVHRAALFGVLHRAVVREKIDIVTDAGIDGFDVAGERATLIAANGRKLGQFDLVVDATGARSLLRRHARVPVERKALAYGAFWASLDWHDKGFDERSLLQRYHKASVMVGVLPIGRMNSDASRQAAFFWSLKPAHAERVKQQGLDAWKDRLLDIWPDCEPYTRQISDFSQLTLAEYGHHTLKQPVGRHLAVVGDAAHSASPQLGQGANMALLDVCALSHALETSLDLPTALEVYAGMRRRHVRTFQALSYAFTPFYQSDSTFLPLMRDWLVPYLARIPPTPKLLASMVSGTIVDPFSPMGLKEIDWRR